MRTLDKNKKLIPKLKAANAVMPPKLAGPRLGEPFNVCARRAIGNNGVQRQLQRDESGAENRTGLPDNLKAGLERHSGLDLSDVRVIRNSPKPAALNALAYTQGRSIHLAPNQEKHLPHEGWHVVQQLQGRVKEAGLHINNTAINTNPRLESEANRLGRQSANPNVAAQPPPRTLAKACFARSAKQPVQREVRVGGGSARVKEADYLLGGRKSAEGSRFPVRALIKDNVRRVFSSVAELESYANGKTDYIGDVKTSAAGTLWYRLPENRLTVLGERHHNPNGNVEDVILGLNTARFMYEPYHEFTDVPPIAGWQLGDSTQKRMQQIESGLSIGSRVKRGRFEPHLENIVIKAITGAAITRNEFIAGNPATMRGLDKKTWSARATTGDYSYGERVALYLSMAIHIANDISAFHFGPEILIESLYFNSARKLSNYYRDNQGVLDAFMNTKDNDDLIGIFELTAKNGFADLRVFKMFTLKFHEYASRYIEQLGVQQKNAVLEQSGQALSGNLGATLQTLSPAREEIMWERVLHGTKHNYLIAGMGDAHRQNLKVRLSKASIRHEEIEQGLQAQQRRVNSRWVS